MRLTSEDTCKGLVYRYERQGYIASSGAVTYKESSRKLKRQSCSGCIKCAAIEESLHEFICCTPENVLVDSDI